MEGKKYDGDKLRYDLISPGAIEDMAKVLTHGSKKYGDRNWEKGMKWGRVYAAIFRHLFAWVMGEKLDPDSGLTHLSHAFCNVMFLMEFERRNIGEDDITADGEVQSDDRMKQWSEQRQKGLEEEILMGKEK